ncbi:MAG: response regulator [Deltaproteobacteria bacterium]|nr:response regulator [Deltaproteobacteria bacterium]
MESLRTLLIEDNPVDAALVRELLAGQDGAAVELEWTSTVAKGLERLDARGIDVVLLDLNLPDSRGMGTLTRVQARAPELPVVVMTGTDDFELAVRAVRTGAQDYLVKGRIDGPQLLRAVRYAVARKTGVRREITAEELAKADGKEGRPAWFAFQGLVYDVTGSRMWKEGIHARKHNAGQDLSRMLAGAPHGEEVLARFPIVGTQVRERTLAERTVAAVERLHLHPISVHFPMACSVLAALSAVACLASGDPTFETMSWYLLVTALATTAPAIATGIFAWLVTYKGRLTPLLRAKLVASGVFTTLLGACFAWRLASPGVLLAGSAAGYAYLVLLLSLVPSALVVGRLGGKIVFPE